jgi:hypothetical protein
MKSIYLILLLGLGWLSSCTISEKKKPELVAPAVSAYQSAYYMINEGATLLKDGDLVLRNGQELSSQLIRSFSKKDKTYSHAGVVFFENGYPMVYHVLVTEENPDRGFRKDSFFVFCNPRTNFGFGIYRYDFDSTELINYQNVLMNWYKKGVQFDPDFDYQTDDKMYCSEMISKALAIATKKRIIIKKTIPTEKEAEYFANRFNKPVGKIRKVQAVAADDLYLIPDCRKIKQYQYPTH